MTGREPDRAQFAAILLAIVLAGVGLRTVFPTADPPWHTPVGIVWHDEGPWVHNARNKVLFGQWSLDRWNPMYLAPVFAGLEYASFASFGVGTWQARLVSEAMGTVSIVFIALGVAALGGRRAGLVAGAMLATNYIYVMWDRAALMEATMTAFMTLSWAAYAMSDRRPAWGAAAGVFALLAFFTKAAAAFFVGALGLDALIVLALGQWEGRGGQGGHGRLGAWWTLAGLALGGLVALVVFVIPYWSEFRFYNWQMSVTRKPSYTVKAFLDRASWIPIIHDFFTRQWLITVLAVGGLFGLARAWRRVRPAERLLGSWIVLGLVELVLHDVGNERRFVFFIPALVALAAIAIAREGRLLPATLASATRRGGLVALPAILLAFYVILGAVVRLPHLYEVRPGVHMAALAAFFATAALFAWWPRLLPWLTSGPWTPASGLLVAAIVVGGDLIQFEQWAALRTYKNVTAARLVGDWLPPGTLVHGKLANGLSLENRIRPVFVGHLFGNYDDRASRPDVHYVLTYTRPRLGYEGPVILDVLAAHPGWKILHEFDVAETADGDDRAALIEKP